MQIDPLESRRLLAVTAAFSSGDLTVTGDTNANAIEVTFQDVSGTDYLIVKDGTTTLFDGTPSGQNIATAAVSAITVDGAAGDDTLTLGDVDTANGFTGLDGAILISGGDDNDAIVGSGFDDSLSGGGGSDTYMFGAAAGGSDTLTEAADVDRDTLWFVFADVDVTIDLSSTSAQNWGDGTVTFSNATGFENVLGSSNHDDIVGNSRNNAIIAGDGNDTVDAGAGDDSIQGNEGDDSLSGGSGSDTYFLDADPQGNDTITEAANSDTDVLDFSAFGNGIALDFGSTSLQYLNAGSGITLSDATGIENIIGTAFNDGLTGNSRANRIEGGGSGDAIDGGSGNDTLLGGDDGDNLTGGAGDDTLDGGAGDDLYVFTGSALGSDTINELSGNGDDSFDFSGFANAVTIDLDIGTQQDIDSGGTKLKLTLTDTTAVEGVVGSAFDDILSGNPGSNVFTGNGGDDILSGRGGDDLYVFSSPTDGNDTVNEAADVDNDALVFLDSAVAVDIDLSDPTPQNWGGGTITLPDVTGTEATGLETIHGSGFSDTLTGNSRNNLLFGYGGNDTIDGLAGDDQVFGGDGGDFIVTGVGNDTVDGEEGFDGLFYVGSETVDALSIAHNASNMIQTSTGTITPSNFVVFSVDTAGGDDSILLDESSLVDMGFTAISLNTGAGNDTVSLNFFKAGGPGLPFGSFIDLGAGDDNASIFTVAGTPSQITNVIGGTGDDTLTVYEEVAGAISSINFDGGDDNDTLSIESIVSTTVTVFDDHLDLSDSGNPSFSNTENVSLDTTGGSANLISIGSSTATLPTITITGDSSDTLDVTSALGDTIDSIYSSVAGTNTFIVDGTIADITSSGITNFVLNAQTINFDGISLDQFYDVTTNFVDPVTQQINRDGKLSFVGDVDPGGFTPSSSATLIQNNSDAILSGRFTADSQINIAGAQYDYDVQYVSDIELTDRNVSDGVRVTTANILTNLDTIPRFLYTWMLPDASNVNRAIASGNWSDSDIWSFGVVPTEGDLVQITPDVTVTYDVINSTDDIRALEILGSLVFATNVDTQLLVGTIEVIPGGRLEIGSVAAPISASNEAIVTFANDIPYLENINGTSIDPEQFGTGLLGYGDVSIHGAPIGTYSNAASQTWLRLSGPVTLGATKLNLETALPSGWNIGDSIVLPDTRQVKTSEDSLYNIGDPGTASQTEVLEIQSISPDRKTITLTSTVAYEHLGGKNTAGQYETFPHIALLNRNVTLTSENPAGYRGHTLYGGRADVDIRYANFENLGRVEVATPLNDPIDVGATEMVPNHIARYALHTHHLSGPLNPTNTGYQFKLIGNTSQFSKTWGVTIHGSSFGLIADNVVYNVDGAGYVTEDGTEIGNQFLNNISLEVQGTLRDGELGGNNPASSADFGIARGGSGFWFRRSGNDIIGNVAADNMYAGMVITSYYNTGAKVLPDFRGANPALVDQTTPTLNNSAETIENNEFYGKSKYGVWLAYLSGGNLSGVQPNVVLKDLTLWNAGLNSFVRIYHSANVTFDNLLVLSDTESQDRTDTGVVGVDMRLYENINTTIVNSRIEGTFRGIFHSQSTTTPFGGALSGTRVDNTILKNYINIVVLPSIELRGGAGNYLEIVDTAFELLTPLNANASNPTNKPPPQQANIRMRYAGNGVSDHRVLNEFSIVKVENYNQVAGDNFQVFYNEQAADHVMETTDWSWFLRFGDSQIGAPAGSFLTNQQLWDMGNDTQETTDDLKLATFGFIAPANATTRTGIDGLVGATDEFLDPTTQFSPKVVFATPWNGSSFIGKAAPADNLVPVNFNVLGLVPQGGAIKLQLKQGITILNTRDGPLQDGFWGGLATGQYTLRGFIVDAQGVEVADSVQEVTFDILPLQVRDVTLTPFAVDDPLNEIDDVISTTEGDVIQPAIDVRQLLMASGGEAFLTKGIAITATTGPQGQWQYRNGQDWINVPAVSPASAFILAFGAQSRFVVDGNVTDPTTLADPTIQFVTWDQDPNSGSNYQSVDSTTSNFGTTNITVTQPLTLLPT